MACISPISFKGYLPLKASFARFPRAPACLAAAAAVSRSSLEAREPRSRTLAMALSTSSSLLGLRIPMVITSSVIRRDGTGICRAENSLAQSDRLHRHVVTRGCSPPVSRLYADRKLVATYSLASRCWEKRAMPVTSWNTQDMCRGRHSPPVVKRSVPHWVEIPKGGWVSHEAPRSTCAAWGTAFAGAVNISHYSCLRTGFARPRTVKGETAPTIIAIFIEYVNTSQAGCLQMPACPCRFGRIRWCRADRGS